MCLGISQRLVFHSEVVKALDKLILVHGELSEMPHHCHRAQGEAAGLCPVGERADPRQGGAADVQGTRGSRRSQIQPLPCRFLPYPQEHPTNGRLDPSDTFGCAHQRMFNYLRFFFYFWEVKAVQLLLQNSKLLKLQKY